MEAEWMQQIPNWIICDWYYLLFLINVITFVILFIGFIVLALKGWSKTFMGMNIVVYSISGIFAGTNALFFYLICNRTLKPVKGF